MAGTAVQRRLIWLAAEAVSFVEETPRVRRIVFDCPGWSGHLAGQHVDIRLTAEDGYQAQRSYSLAAPADGDRVSITVELVDDGEVSPYLIEELRVGDSLELRDRSAATSFGSRVGSSRSSSWAVAAESFRSWP